ncbi:aftiphilin [Sabethes cyaneus]|uniref:aftiphilin n=1 Tax=Sabethes cyaneus TaxID=53552 RepID=UPI00237DE741|nr:aftiphilin [Sabethes cyaneus]
MSSQIPPLFCHTPPPMDFGDEDDVDDLPDPEEDDFDDFATIPGANTPNLPTPVLSPFPESDKENSPVKKPPVQKNSETASVSSLSATQDIAPEKEDEPVRIESPPSLILSQHVYSENDLPSEDEFQDFAYHINEEDRKKTFVPQESEDNLSIPSLHLDTEVSKSTTPVYLSENEISEQNLSPQEPGVADTEQEPIVEAAVAPVIAEDQCYRFDDNTENDFTDFTTASNERSAVLEIPTANDVSFDDDFAQLESTPSADSNFVSQSKTDFATFDADFSKFDSFPVSFPATCGDEAADSVVKDAPTRFGPGELEEKTTLDTANEDNLSQDDFDDFQGFTSFASTSTAAKSVEAALKEEDKEESDDFGDFSDFKQSEVSSTPATVTAVEARSALFSPESIQNIISGMFPMLETPSDTGQKSMGSELLQNKLYHDLEDVDSTKALSYQYSSSESSKSLVQALGIDSRNILFGPKWNSSMPRFAANLSFSPLEPMKPASISYGPTVTVGASSSTTVSASGANRQEIGTKYHTLGLDSFTQPPTGPGIGSVPAVQFDWNSSGLVNPLDGVQEILQEGGTFQPNKNGSAGEILDKKISENASSPASDEVVTTLKHESGLSTPEKSACNALPSDHDDGFTEYASSSNQLKSIPTTTMTMTTATVTMTTSSTTAPQQSVTSSPLMAASGSVVRVMKLPETHIFTPSKCVSPVSRDSTDRTDPYGETSVPVETASSKDIAVREYHDVEYSLEKTSSKGQNQTDRALSNAEDDFDDFHEFQAVCNTTHATTTNTEGDQRVPESRRTHLDVGSEFNFGDRKEKLNVYSKPVFGTSPTEELDQLDDDFSDFQAAPACIEDVKTIVNKPIAGIASEQNRSNTSSPILLSASILLPQQSNRPEPVEVNKVTQINWPEPGIDPEELARFEAAFPKPKIANTVISNSFQHIQATAKNTTDDDEWSDFVYSKPAVPGKASPKTTKTTTTATTASNQQQEEWTDFIYSTPVTQTLSSSQNNFNYNNSFAGPKFSSWNQPQLPPPQFSSWNSTNFYYNASSNHNDGHSSSGSSGFTKPSSQNPAQKVPTFSPTHHAQPPRIAAVNNYYQSTLLPTTGNQPQRAGKQAAIPVISHLPELSFITPNASSGSTKSGMKPLTPSFLSNVISSNNFTKK